MARTKYLIVGAGMTAAAAVVGIREVDGSGTITLVGADPDPPYNRPPLTKALWKGGTTDDIWRPTAGPGIDLRLGRRIVTLDPATKRAVDDRGEALEWDRALVATGGRPRRLTADASGEVVYYRTLTDYRRLREMAVPGRRIAVVGGGFIGSEIAAGLALNGVAVTMVFPGPVIGARVFPAPLGEFVTSYYREHGVEIVGSSSVTGVARKEGHLAVSVAGPDGAVREIQVAGVVAGLGIDPDVELARAAGIAVDNGIAVDERLRTSVADVLAAGDVAAFPSAALGRRVRVEHEDNANTMGRLAGRNLAGAEERYDHLPFFYSDLFDLGYEAVGDIDSRLETVADWKEPFREGVVFYLRQGRVQGVLLWNVWEKVDAARRLITRPDAVPREALDRGALDAPRGEARGQ